MLFTACSKTGFLNTNPDPSLVVPSTLADYQAILNNDLTMNGEAGNGLVPALGEIGADNYYITYDFYNGYLTPLLQRAYVWDKNVFENEQIYDWNIPYQSIDRANIVLDGLASLDVSPVDEAEYNTAKGAALFYRAHVFYQLAQVFAKPYDADSAANWLGIPLRGTSSLNEAITRASVQATYDKIIADLKTALALLPPFQSYQTQPGKAACYALLSRTYLTMQEYGNALLYADSCLQIKNDLMDYNGIDPNSYYPFAVFNSEDIFQCEMIKGPGYLPVNPNYCYADSLLYNSYEDNDLRKKLFFNPKGAGFSFKGSYSGYNKLFAGIATDEVYLIRAECKTRNGNDAGALADLNTLLQKRYKAGTYIPYTVNNTTGVLALVLAERRKELCFRGLRWTDIRRLNKDGGNIVLQRSLNGSTYTLPPNDDRYVYPIPQPVIDMNPGMQQNSR